MLLRTAKQICENAGYYVVDKNKLKTYNNAALIDTSMFSLGCADDKENFLNHMKENLKIEMCHALLDDTKNAVETEIDTIGYNIRIKMCITVLESYK